MLKTILGYILLLIGILCILSVLGNIVRLTIRPNINSDAGPFEILMAIALTIVIGFLCFKYGLRWVRKKPVDSNAIENIGTQETE